MFAINFRLFACEIIAIKKIALSFSKYDHSQIDACVTFSHAFVDNLIRVSEKIVCP